MRKSSLKDLPLSLYFSSSCFLLHTLISGFLSPSPPCHLWNPVSVYISTSCDTVVRSLLLDIFSAFGFQVTTTFFCISFHLTGHSFCVSRLFLLFSTTVRLPQCLVLGHILFWAITFSQGNFYPKPYFMTINNIYKLMTSKFFFLVLLLSWALDACV